MKDGSPGGPARGVRRPGTLLRFATVGVSGALVNLAVLHLLAGALRVHELVASAAAIEASILSNFVLNDSFTFRGNHASPWHVRLARYHLVSALGVAIQFGSFALALLVSEEAGRPALGPARYAAQAVGIGLAFGWNFVASSRFAWATAGSREARRAPGPLLPALLFAALLVLHAVPVWLVHYLPTQDGPLHVENVFSLLRWPGSPLLHRYYLANWGMQPNWLTQLLLIPLLRVVSAPTAEKLLLTGYTLLLPICFRAVLPRGARGWWGSLAVFPFVHAFPYYMGFWNFCWGMALAFLAVGFWQRARGRLGPERLLALLLLGVGLYLTHAAALGGALVAIAGLGLFRAGLSLVRSRGAPARRRLVLRAYLWRGAGAAAAFAPGLLLLAAWMLAHRDHAVARIPLRELAAKFLVGYAMVSIDRRELFLAMAVMLVLDLAALWALWLRRRDGRRLCPADGWLGVAASFAVLYFAVPDVADAGAHISDRMALLCFLSAVAWLSARAAPLRLVRAAGLALAGLAVVALGIRFQKERVLSAYLAEYVSATRAVAADSVLLPLALAPAGPRDARGRKLGYRIKPFLHATGWIVARRGGVDLKNSQANTDQCPVRFPPARNPFRIIAASIGRMEGVPPCVDLRSAPRVGPIDYVLVSGASRENLNTPCGAALASDLAARFEPVFLSQPTGLVEVWRPRTQTAQR